MTASEETATRSGGEGGDKRRAIRYEHSLNLGPLLDRLGISLLISTYQAGKLVVLGTDQGRLTLAFHNFERPMGLAAAGDRIAVGAADQIWVLRSSPDLVHKMDPSGRHDGCFLTRASVFTGDIQVHELGYAGDELWVVNTLFSCLCTLHERYSFIPRWQPPFITALAAEDRCHLNGLAVADGRPKYVTALGETDTPQGWRPGKAGGGCLIDVARREVVVRGLTMPHSPRVHQGRVWLLDSGLGQLVVADEAAGRVETVAAMPGYARGLACHAGWAFIGLSRIRETSTFGGVPIAERRNELRCGLAAVNLATGQAAVVFDFHAGVDEIFDIQVLPGVRSPLLSGPFPAVDGGKVIWVVPEPGAGDRTATRRARRGSDGGSASE